MVRAHRLPISDVVLVTANTLGHAMIRSHHDLIALLIEPVKVQVIGLLMNLASPRHLTLDSEEHTFTLAPIPHALDTVDEIGLQTNTICATRHATKREDMLIMNGVENVLNGKGEQAFVLVQDSSGLLFALDRRIVSYSPEE